MSRVFNRGDGYYWTSSILSCTSYIRHCGLSTRSSGCGATRKRCQPYKRSGIMKAVRALVFAMAFLGASRLEAQQYFGQNQVQYKHFKWRVLETEHFLVHYYPEERKAVVDAARMAERSYARLSRILGHQFREKKPIILFASRADFGQNNVTGDLGEGVGGVTESQRHRLILPLTGDLGSFEHVLAHEMVHEFQYDVFSRGRAGANQQGMERLDPPLWS